MEYLILPKNNQARHESHEKHMLDYTIKILHVRPEISKDVDFLLTYKAREDRGEKFVEEVFTKAFKTAHPSWIIKKVTVKVSK
jgi:hypothetical protein